MSRQPAHERPGDEPLDRLLQEALAVEPSPALLARVRARVAVEQVGHPGGAWAWISAAAVLVAALAAAVSSPWGGRVSHSAREAIQPVHLAGRPPAPVPLARPVLPHAAGHPAEAASSLNRAGLQARAPSPTPGPEVLLAPGDREAFRLLLAVSRAGVLPPEILTGTSVESDAILPGIEVPEVGVEVPAIEVPALVIPGVAEGEPQ